MDLVVDLAQLLPPSPQCLLSLTPSMLPLFWHILYRGLFRVGFWPSFPRSLAPPRSVLSPRFPNVLRPWHCWLIVVTQVIAPYLVILRVAKRRALTNKSVSGTVEFIRFKSQGSTDYGDESLPDGDPTDAAEVNGETSGEVVAREESVIEEVPS